ncbi:hypothetical protein [Gluconobacter japonicus]|uniref:Uncharacterized protein n=1 Tax=Gluconobacter japonicus TaxID=376620 RepID=A0ABQ5WID1_GLUJA|nr:hypothetical protein [Gluconobacter japonicus]KXV30006.1 hypothetical protein AD938_00605 [Gluconobacter japonicus]GBR24779.1 hypothetical protein AA3271_1870 [Gluconobacter japonicus NBRC 3271]GLQ59617.1 hypothetical protein GCM10010937_14200 [Gluconobacter japonicus]
MPTKNNENQSMEPIMTKNKEMTFKEYINSELPELYDGRALVIESLRNDTREIPILESEDDLISFVASHPNVSIPPYGILSGLYAEWRGHQFHAARGGVE